MVAFLTLASAPLSYSSAQVLRGSIRDSAQGAPLASAVISALDSLGVTKNRTIAGSGGQFAITIARDARRIRVVRIGYQPREFAIDLSRDSTADIRMVRLPPVMESVQVTASELCPGHETSGVAFQFWDDARAGLLASVVAREARPAQVKSLLYDRGMSTTDARVLYQTSRIHSGFSNRPFVATAAPSEFARRGYLIDASTGRIFSAPDADVLLDESFAATHCFRAVTDEAHAGQIGLDFSPVSGRDTIVDVRGVLWIDRAVPKLRSLDFLYTSLEPAAARARSGGHLEFQTMPNGVAFIERWHMRFAVLAPVLGPTTRLQPRDDRIRISRRDREDLRVTEIHETGGIVIEAEWSDGSAWHEPPAGVEGVVEERGAKRPLGGALASLEGTLQTTVADSSGRFVLAPLPPGKYTLAVSDTAQRGSGGEESATQVIDVRRGQLVPVRVELKPARRVVTDDARATILGNGRRGRERRRRLRR